MGMVRASPPELHMIFDPLEGMIAVEREDVVQFALDPIMAQIDEINRVTDDLLNSLDPQAVLYSSYKGREGASYMAGIYTNIWYGFVIGLVVALVYLLSQGGVF
ncbi:tetrahydromethanopterin S-methyltransferase subunit MtrB [Methanocrinis sp.]|uniref:tetrahydromethanopterin S-methyltransferase subunit MtrB n=1 Tax=Methanocrinis sp. TaxID=3101522 RepID=UPI003D0B47F3